MAIRKGLAVLVGGLATAQIGCQTWWAWWYLPRVDLVYFQRPYGPWSSFRMTIGFLAYSIFMGPLSEDMRTLP